MVSTNHWLRRRHLRFSAAHLLVALAAMFIVLPFADATPNGNLIESIIFSLVMLAGITALGGTWRTQLVAIGLALPALFARWINHVWPDAIPAEIGLVVAIAFVLIVFVHLLRYVVRTPVVDAEVLCSAVAGYLLIALFWAFANSLLAQWRPQEFAFDEPLAESTKMWGFIALYYSVQVLTTVTFGDVTPAGNVARMFANIEAMSGVLYVTILIARLVGTYTHRRSGESR